MNTIITAILSVTAIGAVCAVILSAASKFMASADTDERAVRILECLPGSNCGACGYPGCSGYAAALVSEPSVKNNLCTPGGINVLKQINAILNEDTESDMEPILAVVRCRGDSGARQKKMEYTGIQTCIAAKELFGGEGACAFGCLGYGDCKTVCPSGAVCVENGLARINTNLCTGCGLCVKSCPNKLITLENEFVLKSKPGVILCGSYEKGSAVLKKCKKGCIGCGKCVRECTAYAITIENNLAVINYEKCNKCGHCAELCVTKCIRS